MKLSKKIIFTLLLTILFGSHLCGFTGGNDREKKKASPSPGGKNSGVSQAAPDLKPTLTFSELASPPVLTFESAGDPINVTYHPDAAVGPDVQRAHDLFDYVMRENRITDYLSGGALQSLPIGVRKTIGNKQYVIVIDSMVLTPTAAYLVAYMSLPIPQSEQKLAFKGSNIRFTKSGGLTGSVKLSLLEDISIAISNHSQINMLRENGETFIDWDCSGFKSLGINAEVEFSRDYLVPDNEDGSIGEGRVKGNFKTVINDWNDLIAEVSLAPFQVAKLKGFGFYVNRAVFDFSDLNNAPGIVFPEAYQSANLMEGNPELWQGFYLKEIQIRLPLHFSSRNGGRKQVEGYDLFIDHLGFSGTLAAKKMLSLEEGTMSGWKFSLDSIGISIVTNEIRTASFKGQLNVPVFKEDQLFSYSAVITSENDYLFTVKNDSAMQMSLFAAKADIDKNSYLEINIIDGQFKPKAVLNGKLTINAGMSDKADGAKTSIADLTFEALEISTVSPYISVGAFSFGSEAKKPKVANFPVSLENVDLKINGKDVNLGFDIVVNLVGSGDGGFGARGGLILKSEMEYADNLSFKFTGVELTKLDVKIDGGAYKIEGSLQLFKDDATFGNGIKGTVSASFQPGLDVQAMALFGTVNGDRYWFADALAKFNGGIAVFPGFGVYGFGGGVYYHMKQQGYETDANSIGASLSGIVYKPDPQTFLGLKATINLGTHPKPEAFSGDATLEISFNNSGGVNLIAFTGNGYFAAPPLPASLTELKKKAELLSKATGQQSSFDDSKGSIQARLLITFDIPNQTLHGNLTTYANVGGGIIRGAGANNLCGEAILHFSPDEWYIHIGTPQNRMALNLVGFFTVKGYMMVGTNIPAMPAPPSEVMEILSGINMDRSNQLEALSKGEGFAFGASFSYSTGDMRFLMFYARFDAGAGFDVMLKNYGSDVSCVGQSGPIGINGWYASGQAYGYFRGAIGISIDLMFYSGDFEIMSISAAVLLRAKLPNPIFLQGTVGGRFSILGGLVKGNCQFQMTIGEECRMQGSSPLEGERVIAAITPSQGDEDVDIFTSPQVVFNMPIDKEFEFVNSQKQTKSFRAKLGGFSLVDGNKEIPTTLKWNDDKTVAVISPVNLPSSQKLLKIKVNILFDEKIMGTWRPVYINGKAAIESREVTYTTGDAPAYIPLSNVSYSYPLIDQYNFYPQETTKGYIKLLIGQPELFKPSDEWLQVGRFTSAAGQKMEFPFTYTNQQITFTLPQGFNNNTIYAFEIVNVPKNPEQSVDANVRESTIMVENTGVEMRSRTAEGNIRTLKDKSIFTTHFRTSRFNRFLDKMESMPMNAGALYPIYTDIHQIISRMEGPEVFDKYEIQSSEKIDRLVEFEADLTNEWYADFNGPLIYAGYPYAGAAIQHRVANALGVPPIRAIFLQQDASQLLSAADVQNGIPSATTRSSSMVNNMVFEVYQDYYELQQRAAYLSQYRDDAWIRRILTGRFQQIMPGSYKVNARYVLPGIKETTSQIPQTINVN
jgi:hypothetical protein